MAKRSENKDAVQEDRSVVGLFGSPPSVWIALLLAAVAFLVYWPSLKSDFVYDARNEILEEGFITSISNLPQVLSLKVLGMNLMLGARPGQLLYLMLIAAVCGKEPFGYHLCSNLLHAANVGLLFLLLIRLAMMGWKRCNKTDTWKIQLAAAAVSLIFAVHPISAETVSAVNYSSDLLMTLFTLVALLTATYFQPDNKRVALITGSVGALCALASVTCKESGIATALLLIVYWFLYRRDDAKKPWLLFLGAALGVTMMFLAARFLNPPPNQESLRYLGGSFLKVFWIQPRLWVFMMGKLIWPTHLSADYTLENVSGVTEPVAMLVLLLVVGLQVMLATKSRLGALGVAAYWLGLATVSNFTPLFRVVADRFYYLPMAGVAMQLLALLLLAMEFRRGFWIASGLCFVAVVPLAFFTVEREEVFSNGIALWTDTIQTSPLSWTAYANYGRALVDANRVDEAMVQYQRALGLNPNYADAEYDLGLAYAHKGQSAEAIDHYQKALKINPDSASAHNNLGNVFFKIGQLDQAEAQYEAALKTKPDYGEAHNNLANVFLQQHRVDDAIREFKRALEIEPQSSHILFNLGVVYLKNGQVDDAVGQLQRAVELDPDDAVAWYTLGNAFLQKGEAQDAILKFQKAVEIAPDYVEAHGNLGVALMQTGQVDEAVSEFREVVRLQPNSAMARNNLEQAEAMAAQKAGQ
jgi:tetratricopeptide (TPR) repeat protein